MFKKIFLYLKTNHHYGEIYHILNCISNNDNELEEKFLNNIIWYLEKDKFDLKMIDKFKEYEDSIIFVKKNSSNYQEPYKELLQYMNSLYRKLEKIRKKQNKNYDDNIGWKLPIGYNVGPKIESCFMKERRF